jgi:phage shock protein B
VLASVVFVVGLGLCMIPVLTQVAGMYHDAWRNLFGGGSGMETIGYVILVLLSVPLVLVVGVIVLVALKILKSDGSRADETRLIQDLHHGLLKMEQRVETLETLLLDKQRKGNPS